jgi:hypothetical protein
VFTSHQVIAPGSSTTPAPMCSAASHTPTAAPAGSAIMASRPDGPSVMGAISTCPPAAAACSTTWSALPATQTLQWLGIPWAAVSLGIDPPAAASRPSRRKNRWIPSSPGIGMS